MSKPLQTARDISSQSPKLLEELMMLPDDASLISTIESLVHKKFSCTEVVDILKLHKSDTARLQSLNILLSLIIDQIQFINILVIFTNDWIKFSIVELYPEHTITNEKIITVFTKDKYRLKFLQLVQKKNPIYLISSFCIDFTRFDATKIILTERWPLCEILPAVSCFSTDEAKCNFVEIILNQTINDINMSMLVSILKQLSSDYFKFKVMTLVLKRTIIDTLKVVDVVKLFNDASFGDKVGTVFALQRRKIQSPIVKKVQSPIIYEDYQGQSILGECKICMNHEASYVFTGCGHLCSCGSCASKLAKCPICNLTSKSVKLYL